MRSDGTVVKEVANVNVQMPKIFHVNWFRKDRNGNYLWPGYGENIRVIDWIVRRLEGDTNIGERTPIGVVPKQGSLNLDGLDGIKMDELMSVPKTYWQDDAKEVRRFLEEQVCALNSVFALCKVWSGLKPSTGFKACIFLW